MVTGGGSRGGAIGGRGRQRTIVKMMLTVWSRAVMAQNDAAAITEAVMRIEICRSGDMAMTNRPGTSPLASRARRLVDGTAHLVSTQSAVMQPPYDSHRKPRIAVGVGPCQQAKCGSFA